MTVADLPGAAHLMLVDGVAYLDPASAVFEAMLDGWAGQQRTRYLKADTIGSRIRLVRRLSEFTNQYPWQWTCAEVEAFFDHLRSGSRPAAAGPALRCPVPARPGEYAPRVATPIGRAASAPNVAAATGWTPGGPPTAAAAAVLAPAGSWATAPSAAD